MHNNRRYESTTSTGKRFKRHVPKRWMLKNKYSDACLYCGKLTEIEEALTILGSIDHIRHEAWISQSTIFMLSQHKS